MARLSAASRPVATVRLVYSSTVGLAQRGRRLPRGRRGHVAGAAQYGGHVQFDGGDAGPGAQRGQLAAGLADVRADHDQAVPAGPAP